MSGSEKKLWARLRRDALGVRFRRQVPVGPYVLDFYCPAAKLVVEVDGPLHAQVADAKRDAFLEGLGMRVIRVPSFELFPPRDRTEQWVQAIFEAVEDRRLPPCPPQFWGGTGVASLGLRRLASAPVSILNGD